MRLAKDLRERYVNELRYVVQKMQETSDPATKIYLFSVGYGEASRILNIQWDANLALAHLVLQQAYANINACLTRMAAREQRPIELPGNFWGVLEEATKKLADVIEQGDDQGLLKALARFAELAYVTTGNGFYLYMKQVITI